MLFNQGHTNHGVIHYFSFFLRFRTAINVLGDSIGAGIVYELSKGDLEEVANKKTTDGGFEAVPMTEIEDDNK